MFTMIWNLSLQQVFSVTFPAQQSVPHGVNSRSVSLSRMFTAMTMNL